MVGANSDDLVSIWSKLLMKGLIHNRFFLLLVYIYSTCYKMLSRSSCFNCQFNGNHIGLWRRPSNSLGIGGSRGGLRGLQPPPLSKNRRQSSWKGRREKEFHVCLVFMCTFSSSNPPLKIFWIHAWGEERITHVHYTPPPQKKFISNEKCI